jgi:hypothetical protein
MKNRIAFTNCIKDYHPIGYNFNNTLLWISVLTFLSGAIRKWVFTSSSVGNIILLIQLVLPFLISFKHNGLSLPTKNNLFKVYTFFLFISAFNPMNLTIFHGLLGVILYLGFWWLMAYYFENRHLIDITPLIPFTVVFCIIEIVLGFIQYQLSADHILNKYAAIDQLGDGQVIASVGNSVRITGTFSYISGYTSFLIFAVFFLWSLIRLGYNKKVVAFLFSGIIVVNQMSGSRGSALISILILSIMIFSEFTKVTIFGFFRSLFFPLIFLALFYSIKGFSGFENTIENAFINFDERRAINAQSGEQNQRIASDIKELFFEYRGKYPFFGVGLGSTYQGATSLFGISDYVKEYGYYEGELPRIVLEAGFIMLLLRVLLFFWLLTWLQLNKLSKVVCFIIFAYGIGNVFNIYNAIFLALGLIFLDNAGLQNKRKQFIVLS